MPSLPSKILGVCIAGLGADGSWLNLLHGNLCAKWSSLGWGGDCDSLFLETQEKLPGHLHPSSPYNGRPNDKEWHVIKTGIYVRIIQGSYHKFCQFWLVHNLNQCRSSENILAGVSKGTKVIRLSSSRNSLSSELDAWESVRNQWSDISE